MGEIPEGEEFLKEIQEEAREESIKESVVKAVEEFLNESREQNLKDCRINSKFRKIPKGIPEENKKEIN